jgi:hypothetical protein
MSSTEGRLVIRRFHQEERMDDILRGGFTKSREPLDLAEEQGNYDGSIIYRFEAQEG